MTDWDESEHPRHPAGSDRGGRFRRGPSLGYKVFAEVDPEWAKRVMQRLIEPGYRPGAWAPMDLRDYKREWLADSIAAMGDFEGADETAEEMWRDWDPPVAVYANGPHRVLVDTEQDLPLDEVFAQLDELHSRFPAHRGPIKLGIAPMDALDGNRGLMLPGTSVLYLATEIFGPWLRDPAPGWIAPAAGPTGDRKVEQWRYGMIHEWGHVIDQVDHMVNWSPQVGRAQDLVEDYMDSLSGYGRSNAVEGIAEAFTEWYLTRGQSENTAARAYAAEYGWVWRD